MKHRSRLIAILALILVAANVRGQVDPERALSTFTVHNRALEISLWASEPLFANPTCMDIDHLGRVWVCESVNYRYTLHRRPPNRPEGDRIVILEDSHKTGRADKAITFYQSKDLLAPLGIAVAKDPSGPGYKVFVCQSPDILVFEDKDGDGKADGPPRKLLSGFKGIDHDHGVHGILIGPDGKLYFSVGDRGVAGLPGKGGKRWTTNHTDCQAGTIWRCDLDGGNLELIAHNFRNEYEPCVDSFGTVFVSDNDDDGNQQTRICYVMPGGNYGYWPRGPGQTHWHEEQPGVVPKILRTYFGSPTGMCVYEGSLLPEAYRNQLLHTDAGPRQVRCYHLTPEGGGYHVNREDLVTSTDYWFRPSDICVAPDGSVFVADWYDPGVGGHGMGDTTRGRIYRIAPRGSKPSVPAVDLETSSGLETALASPALSVRYMAMAKLMEMPERERRDVLEEALADRANPILRARALWQWARCNVKHGAPDSEKIIHQLEDDTHVRQALADPDPRFRQLAIRILHDFAGGMSLKLAGDLANDSSAAVRRELALSLRDADPSRVQNVFWDLVRHFDGKSVRKKWVQARRPAEPAPIFSERSKDRFYLEALGIAAGADPERRARMLSDWQRNLGLSDENDLELIWELRPPGATEVLVERYARGGGSGAARSRLVDMLGSSSDPAAGRALLRSLPTEPSPEVRQRVISNLRRMLPGPWRALCRDAELTGVIGKLLCGKETEREGLILAAAAGRKDFAGDVARLAASSRESIETRQAAVQTLGRLQGSDSLRALQDLVKEGPTPLSAEAARALGQLSDAEALQSLKNIAMSPATTDELGRAALESLVGSRPGARWLLERLEHKELPEHAVADAGRLLRNCIFKDLRDRALAGLPTPRRLDARKLPELAYLVARRGDATRGKRLLATTPKNDLQCLRCHTIAGVGGQVGPDLSVIGRKASRENLFESILFPSKAIADQYVTWIVETKSGQYLTGLIVEETAGQVTLRDANGKDTIVAKNEIDSRRKSPTSLMPDNLLGYMTEDELIDIVEYLVTLK